MIYAKSSERKRALLLGAMTSAYYEIARDDERASVIARFGTLMEEWRDLGAQVVATLDDDLFMVGEPAASRFTFYLMFDVDDPQVVVDMIQRIRESVDGIRMDRYVRVERRTSGARSSSWNRRPRTPPATARTCRYHAKRASGPRTSRRALARPVLCHGKRFSHKSSVSRRQGWIAFWTPVRTPSCGGVGGPASTREGPPCGKYPANRRIPRAGYGNRIGPPGSPQASSRVLALRCSQFCAICSTLDNEVDNGTYCLCRVGGCRRVVLRRPRVISFVSASRHARSRSATQAR